jgi:DnaJ family protein A protein 2
MGPMIQQMQTACDACDGTGKITARGVKSVKEKKILELHIEKTLATSIQLGLHTVYLLATAVPIVHTKKKA